MNEAPTISGPLLMTSRHECSNTAIKKLKGCENCLCSTVKLISHIYFLFVFFVLPILNVTFNNVIVLLAQPFVSTFFGEAA